VGGHGGSLLEPCLEEGDDGLGQLRPLQTPGLEIS
jgi:hypothetical protein